MNILTFTIKMPVWVLVVLLLTANEGFAVETADNAQPAKAKKHQSYVRSSHAYEIPQVMLTTAHGDQVDVAELFAVQESAIVSFVFTSCAGVCPMISATMASAAKGLDPIDPDYAIYLVSLDPEYDTPERLSSYAERFETGSKVHFLTGEVADIRALLQAVDSVYEGGNKMNHQPITLMRVDNSNEWLRFDGMMTGKAIATEYERAKRLAQQKAVASR
jgi:protein SCO1